MRLLWRLSVVVPFAFCAAALADCGGGGGSPGPSGPAQPVPTATASSTVSPASTPGATTVAGVDPTAPPGSYFVGGMQGETCVPKDQSAVERGTATWLPTEDLCVRSAPGAGIGTIAFSSNAPDAVAISPAINGNGDTQEVRVQRASGVDVTVTIVNHDTGGFGGPINFVMGSDTAAQLYAAQSQPATPNHSIRFGTFMRSDPSPYGIESADGSLDPAKSQDVLTSGAKIGRTSEESFFNDLTGIGQGMSFTRDDFAIAFMLQNNIVPYIDLEAGPKLYAVNGMDTTQALMHNPAEFGAYCSAAAQHLHATFPQLGTSVPAYFGTPANEPNGVWDASLTDNPGLYADSADGPALYMKSCYAAIKAVFPTSVVYGGELKTQPVNGVTDMVSEISRWYAGSAACRVGTCFDGLSLHLSPVGDPTYAVKNCFEYNDGWTLACIGAMQNVATAHGDPAPHIMISETVIDSIQNSDVSAGDEAGQAWYLSKEFAFAETDPYIDGVIWGNLSEDPLYVGTTFYGGSLVDTSTGTDRYKPAFYAFKRFANFPQTFVDPTAPQSERRAAAERYDLGSSKR